MQVSEGSITWEEKREEGQGRQMEPERGRIAKQQSPTERKGRKAGNRQTHRSGGGCATERKKKRRQGGRMGWLPSSPSQLESFPELPAF